MELTVHFWNCKKITVGPIILFDFGAGWLTHFSRGEAGGKSPEG
jgi:hypothetical protein